MIPHSKCHEDDARWSRTPFRYSRMPSAGAQQLKALPQLAFPYSKFPQHVVPVMQLVGNTD